MSGLARKLVICAAIEGLVIQPLTTKGQRPANPIRIRYSDAAISAITRDQLPDISQEGSSFEAFGVIGLVTVSKLSFLITITRRQQVAQIFGHPVYVVTGIAITPCSGIDQATQAINNTARQLDNQPVSTVGNDVESSDEEEVHGASSDEVDDDITETANSERSARSSIAEDVFRKRGSYGRFAQRWFSRGGWTQEQRRVVGLSDSTSSLKPETPAANATTTVSNENIDQAPTTSLLPKLLQAMQVLFGSSRSFYFSYDTDITRNISNSADHPPSEAPLYSQVDTNFFWNRHILSPFIESRYESFALPLMQGFIGQKSFIVDSSPPQVDEPSTESVEMKPLSPSRPGSPVDNLADSRSSVELRPTEKKYIITLISRRSTKRAGLRYMRRGIDENGFTANTVETEQILSSPKWDSSSPIYSFVQIRGSVPLFWTQTAYALKPVPVIQHSPEDNYKACKKHFDRISSTYGDIQVVNLVEKQGVEGKLGAQFQQNVERVNGEMAASGTNMKFEWFDFHHACRGMKFENVSELLLRLKDDLENMGSTVKQDGAIVQRQKGVFRTNCMDCLDRTNVCQSCFAKHILDYQLKAEGIDMSAQQDQETAWFNILWADNGDAVSNQYASTAAMKGDYTRTRKRDYRGALNDLGLSLTRLYNGMVNDYFSQAAIDFLLGNVTGKVFDEFETNMMTKDPAISVSNMRDRAIELCRKRVVADLTEELHGGWVLLSPAVADAVRSSIMQESVLLLTDAALYLCRFDWDLDKVSSFERVSLASVSHIKFGTYITSTVSTSHTDEMRNIGFVVTYQPGKSDIRRTNTRTLSSKGDWSSAAPAETKQQSGFASFFSPKPTGLPSRILAFKAPYTDSSIVASVSGPLQTEIQQVVTICADIERLTFESQRRRSDEELTSIIEEGDIISLESAKRNTGLFEQLGHSIKKLVWA